MRNGHRPKQARKAGFSLIEMLVVILIITTMGFSLAPLFLRNTDRFAMKDTVRHVSDMLAFCRSQAVFEATTFRFIIDREERQCRIEFVKSPDEEPGVFQPYRSSGIGRYKFQSGIEVKDVILDGRRNQMNRPEFEQDQIEFYSDGSSSGGLLVFGTKRPKVVTLSVAAATALIKIEERGAEDGMRERGGEAAGYGNYGRAGGRPYDS